MSNVRSSLAGCQVTAMDTERVKREGWAEQQILVVSLNDPRLSWVERQTLANIGQKLYEKGNP